MYVNNTFQGQILVSERKKRNSHRIFWLSNEYVRDPYYMVARIKLQNFQQQTYVLLFFLSLCVYVRVVVVCVCESSTLTLTGVELLVLAGERRRRRGKEKPKEGNL